jgi:predicted transcriptional regulator
MKVSMMINDELTGLELAKYILLRLVDNNESIEQVAEDFDNDVRFISRVVKFLENTGCLKQNSDSGYQVNDDISSKITCSKLVV